MGLTVEELLETPFLDRSLEEQIRIMLDGKPRPDMSHLAVAVSNDEGAMEVVHFDRAMFDRVAWLTGSENLRSFFCWPCLLFGDREQMWNSDSALLDESILAHENTKGHVQAGITLKTFEMKHMEQTKQNLFNNRGKRIGEKNRDILKLLTDVVCEVVKKVPFRRGNEPHIRVNSKNCIQILELMRNYCNRSVKYTGEAIDWIKKYPTLLDNLVDSINKVMDIRLKKEMVTSTFVSLIVSEHSTDPTHSQLSFIARYIKNGKVYERFLGFANLLVPKTADFIYNLVLNMIGTYEISGKFLSCSFDGAVLEISQLSDFIDMLEAKYPDSYFVPCYCHGPNYVLQQSLSTNEEVGQFFKTMAAMETYFERDSNQWKSFQSFLTDKVPELRNSENCFNDVPLIYLVCSYQTYFIKYLDSVSQSCNIWSADDTINALGLRKFLTDFKTVFLLHVISTVFQLTANLAGAMKNPELDRLFDLIKSILMNLSTYRQEFERFWQITIKEYSDYDEQSAKRLKTDYCYERDEYSQLFLDIANRLYQEIRLRCSNFNKLEYCCLIKQEHRLPPSEVEADLRKDSTYYLNQMVRQQKRFHADQLKSELEALRAQSTLFKDKNECEMLEFLTEGNFKNIFKQYYKLAEFTLTMPFKPPSSACDEAKFERIKKLCYFTDSAIVPGDTSLLIAESDFLQNLKCDDVFFADEVITRFYEVNTFIEH